MNTLAPGYALTRQELQKLSALIINLPITYEHSGIFEAIGNLAERNEAPLQSRVWKELNDIAKNKDVRSSSIGEVIDYWESPNGSWWCTFYIDAVKWEGIVWMIEKSFLRGLSLTHMVHNENLIPYEVSLCFEPARPGCYVYHFSLELFKMDEYKRGVLTKSIREPIKSDSTHIDVIVANKKTMENQNMGDGMETNNDGTMEQKPLIEQIMDKLPKEHRTIFAARFTEMCQRVDEARSAQKTAEGMLDEAKKGEEAALISAKNNECNVGMLKSQLDIMRENLGADMITNYHLSEPYCAPLLESQDPNEVRRCVDRLLLAANAKLMMRSHEITSKKRKTIQEEEADTLFKTPITPQKQAPMVAASKKKVVAASVAEVVSTLSPEEILARAMANSFEC